MSIFILRVKTACCMEWTNVLLRKLASMPTAHCESSGVWTQWKHTASDNHAISMTTCQCVQ